ncbi:MAG: hypothetical protein ACOX9C_10720 [Kiritimatiellia bacterium]|jgi:hypothetical protein
MTSKIRIQTRTACAALVGAFSFTIAASAADFTFDDIHYWIGDGTNQVGIVIDWNNEQPGSSLAWGVRWNGASTNMTEILRRLDHEDRRLMAAVIGDSWGSWVLGFGYDADGDGGIFNTVSPGAATDRDDFIALDDFSSACYWSVVATNASAITDATTWGYLMVGIDGIVPVNNDWFAFKRINWQTGESSFPALPAAAESPFACRVVACVLDGIADEASATNVLGAPARCTRGWPPWTVDATVTPPNPAWSPDQLLTLAKDDDGGGGWVVVAFDHRVMDDPLNPYGLDFIVFGNALHDLGGNQYFAGTEDPATCVFRDSGVGAEPGLVEVSQDGITWYSFADGPFADAFAPTLSHLYDTNAPDASLFAGNLWWGKPTDPTLPVDPSLTATNFIGRTLAEYAVLYNGSAGGTGFDIGAFPLPVDPATGRKWIQYVRVTSLSSADDADWTDVDAFADVAPAAPYDNWARAHYAWTDLPDAGVAGKNAIAANGKPNFYNAAFGTAPDAAPVETFQITDFAIEDGRAVFRIPSAASAFDAFRISRASAIDGTWKDVLPTFEGTIQTAHGVESVFSIPIDPAKPHAFYKVKVSGE